MKKLLLTVLCTITLVFTSCSIDSSESIKESTQLSRGEDPDGFPLSELPEDVKVIAEEVFTTGTTSDPSLFCQGYTIDGQHYGMVIQDSKGDYYAIGHWTGSHWSTATCKKVSFFEAYDYCDNHEW